MVVSNTPEKEISCGDSVVDKDPKFGGGSELCPAQNGLGSVENCLLGKENCVSSGGVCQMKFSTSGGCEVEISDNSLVVQDPVSLDKSCAVSGSVGEVVDSGGDSVTDEASCCAVNEHSSPEKQISCVVCGGVDDLKFCGGCKSTHYCSKSCQLSHWSYHSIYCHAVTDLERLEKSKRYKNKSVRQSQVDDRTRLKVLKLVGDKPKIRCWLNGN